MVKSVIISSDITVANNQTTSNTNAFFGISGDLGFVNTTEDATVQTIISIAFTMTKLGGKIATNSIAGTSTFTISKNGAGGTETFSVGSSATGSFVDASGSDSLVLNDTICVKFVPGAATNSMNIAALTALLNASSDTVTQLATSCFAGNFSTASSSLYWPLFGAINTFNGTEASFKCRQRKAGTFDKLVWNNAVNTRGTACTMQGRKNGADGAMTATTTPNVSGFYKDTTNSDTIAVGDDYDYELTTDTGTGNIDVSATQLDFTSTANFSQLQAGQTTLRTQNVNLTRFYGYGSELSNLTTETNARYVLNDTFTGSELIILLATNTVTAASTLTTRKNAGAGGQTASITASTAGLYGDQVNTDSIISTDDVDMRLVTGATGTSVTFGTLGIWLSQASAAGVTARPRTRAINLSRYLSMNLGSEMALGVGNQGGIA